MALPPGIVRPVPTQLIPVSVGTNRISGLLPQAQQAVVNTLTGAVTDTQQATVVIPAGGSTRVNLSGISFYFSAMSSAVLGISARPINSGQSRSFINYSIGQGLRLGTSGFQQVELLNLDTVNQNTVTIVVGGGITNNTYDEFIDKRVIIINNPASNVFVQWGPTFAVAFKTRTPAWADTLAAGISQAVADGYNGKSRKQIIFANNSAGDNLTVSDAAGNVIGTVQPSTSWTAETGGTVILKNGTANPVGCNIGEIYYS